MNDACFKSHFVRTNTPHPKELAKKKEALKQRSMMSTQNSHRRQHSSGSETTESPANTNNLPVITTKPAGREREAPEEDQDQDAEEPEADAHLLDNHHPTKHVDFKFTHSYIDNNTASNGRHG